MHIEYRHNTILLCNNEIAFQSVRELAFYGTLKAVMIPEHNKEVIGMLRQFLATTSVKVVTTTKQSLQPDLAQLIKETNANTIWVMTFPYLIPAPVLNLLPGAFINFHYGLLPKYRGPNPILAQMLNYETLGGITVHVMDEAIDTGPLIMQQKLVIEDNDTFGIQVQKLAQLGAEMSVHLLKILNFSTVVPAVPQDTSHASYFNKVTATDLMIKWSSMTSQQVIRLVNSCNPWNKGAGTTIKNNVICFVEAEQTGETTSKSPVAGTIVSLSESDGLQIVCADGKIIRVNIIYLQEGFFSSKKLIGYGIRAGDIFV